MECYSAIKKNEILPFAITWMDLEGILLSEINQKEWYILDDFTYVCNLKNKTNENNNKKAQKQSHRYREQIGGCQKGGGRGDERNR